MPCPMCRADAPELLRASDRNLRVSEREFAYHRCPLCGTVFLPEPPEDLGRYYPERYFPLLDRDGLAAAAAGERYKIELLTAHAPGGRLVEIGPGAGAFAWAAAQAGFEVDSIEMDERNCRHLREVVGIGAVESAAPEEALAGMPPSAAIAMWHNLEHLPRPTEALESVARNLQPGGVLVLAVPNPEALGFRVLGRRWPHLDAPRHLTLFPAHTLVGFLAGIGLRCVSLSASDAGSRHWNAFGWAHAAVPLTAPPERQRVAWLGGLAAATALAPLERRGLRGATYTAAFRKRD